MLWSFQAREHLEEVWPNLEVFFHGGITFAPYRKQYEQLPRCRQKMNYMETYNASEGFFGIHHHPAGNGCPGQLGSGWTADGVEIRNWLRTSSWT